MGSERVVSAGSRSQGNSLATEETIVTAAMSAIENASPAITCPPTRTAHPPQTAREARRAPPPGSTRQP
jgi:hypothetical protein